MSNILLIKSRGCTAVGVGVEALAWKSTLFFFFAVFFVFQTPAFHHMSLKNAL